MRQRRRLSVDDCSELSRNLQKHNENPGDLAYLRLSFSLCFSLLSENVFLGGRLRVGSEKMEKMGLAASVNEKDPI